jgi:hypothetical protein
MHKGRRYYIFVLSIFLCAGCHSLNKSSTVKQSLDAAMQNTTYTQAPEEKKKPVLAVTPLVEKRGNLKSYGSVYKYLIPLVPYGTIRYDRPDETKMFNTPYEFEFNMSENLAKLLVEAVTRSGLFESVILTPTPLESKADLILNGDIQSTLYEGKTYSYGFSFLGPALWCLGLPAGSSHKKLIIGFALKKKDTGEELWSYTLNKQRTVVQGLYHNWGKDVNSFALLMEEGMKEAMADMRLKLAGIPLQILKAKEPDIPLPAQTEPAPQ